MNSKIPDDLLSAFFDGEVTPSEETVAKIRLRATPQAQRELTDYKRMSELVRGLPREGVPSEFAAAVLQRAERETLIPTEAAAVAGPVGPSAIPARSSGDGPSRYRLRIALGALVSVAAAGFLVWLAVPRQPAGGPMVARSEVASKAMPKSGPIPPMVANNSDSMSVGQVASSAVATTRGEAHGGRPALKANMLFGKASNEKKPGQTELGIARLSFPADLKAAEPGAVIEALETTGNQVAVVRLTVVDRNETLEGIESVLVRNTQQTVANLARLPASVAEKQSGDDRKKANFQNGVVVDDSSKNGDMICVYFEGTRDQLAGVLRDVKSQSGIHEAQLTNTISVAELNQYTPTGTPVVDEELPVEKSQDADKSKQGALGDSKSKVGLEANGNYVGGVDFGEQRSSQKQKESLAPQTPSMNYAFTRSNASKHPAAAPPPAIPRPAPVAEKKTADRDDDLQGKDMQQRASKQFVVHLPSAVVQKMATPSAQFDSLKAQTPGGDNSLRRETSNWYQLEQSTASAPRFQAAQKQAAPPIAKNAPARATANYKGRPANKREVAERERVYQFFFVLDDKGDLAAPAQAVERTPVVARRPHQASQVNQAAPAAPAKAGR